MGSLRVKQQEPIWDPESTLNKGREENNPKHFSKTGAIHSCFVGASYLDFQIMHILCIQQKYYCTPPNNLKKILTNYIQLRSLTITRHFRNYFVIFSVQPQHIPICCSVYEFETRQFKDCLRNRNLHSLKSPLTLVHLSL